MNLSQAFNKSAQCFCSGCPRLGNRINENLMNHREKFVEIWNEIFGIRQRRKIAYDLNGFLLYIGSTFSKTTLDNGNDLREYSFIE
jgi:hypothetical protein